MDIYDNSDPATACIHDADTTAQHGRRFSDIVDRHVSERFLEYDLPSLVTDVIRPGDGVKEEREAARPARERKKDIELTILEGIA